jgi:hypothetical protein
VTDLSAIGLTTPLTQPFKILGAGDLDMHNLVGPALAGKTVFLLKKIQRLPWPLPG